MRMIQRWFTDFHCDRTSADNTERSGRPKMWATQKKNVEEIHDVMLNNPRVNFWELAEATTMSYDNFLISKMTFLVFSMKKINEQWLQRLPTINQNRIRKIRNSDKQNCTKSCLNWFLNHHIRQTWPLETSIHFQTYRNSLLVNSPTQMRKLYLKLRPFWRPSKELNFGLIKKVRKS